ncbi:hypothetical protein CCZ20_28460 [Priestia aryabhattai]|uniref:hypothetical protein n=1 Tax=Priestia aryabhattai TaxID=412384 RepID=UPI000B51004D|nr:hypothetical protein [Priestia aryabhattai]OVE34071.1 hypothetical protein CCZ20_28460 [Priestia aryabhattai]
MSNSSEKSETSPNRLMELMMLNILQKHGITKENVKGKVSEDQKKLIYDLLEELKQQADKLVSKTNPDKPNSK